MSSIPLPHRWRKRIAVTVAAFLWVSSGRAQPGTFDPPVLHGGPAGAQGVVAADVDGDGSLDLVTADQGESASVLLGIGDGTFAPATRYRFGGLAEEYDNPRAIALGDLDGDGDLDIVLAESPHVLYTLLGAGDGTFSVGVGGGSASAPVATASEAALADFDGDGDLDLVLVSNRDLSTELTVYNRDGDGGFVLSQVVLYDFEFPYQTGLAVGDLDGDGTPDVAATNGGTQVVVALNDGAGGLLPPAVYTPLNPPGLENQRTPDVVAADFDGDGDLDLATPHHVLLNDGSGAFTGGQTGMGSDEFSLTIEAADFDLDGAVDLVFEGHHTDQEETTVAAVRIARGRGDGTFLPDEPLFPANLGPYPFLSFPGRVAAADLNGDAKPDIFYLASLESVEGVAVLLNDPTRAPDLNLLVEETIAVSDSSRSLPALFLPVEETIAVSDSTALLPALFLPVEETITVSDSTAFLASLLLRVEETVTVSDTTAAVFSVDTEAPPPTDYALGRAYPNPVAHAALIPYALPEAARVRLDLYDALGRRVAVLVDREQPAGYYAVHLRAGALASGTYIVRLEAGLFVGTGTVQVAR